MKSFLEILLAVCLLPVVSSPQTKPRGLTEMSLEQLMSTEVTSVSKRAESLFETAAAIYVISREDIARSGMTSVPELLRMVPGVEVAQITSSAWAVSARGFNGRFANKMLVLVDGRGVYTQVFSGVLWDEVDVMLEDIERIEVIRGPGGSVWGANAVNGVVNIITRRAQDTQGGLLTTTAGSEERPTAAVRYGGQIGDVAYRIWAKYFNRTALEPASAVDPFDAWHVLRGGFRADWDASARDSIMLQGDLYGGRDSQTALLASLNPPYQVAVQENAPVNGGYLEGQWKHVFSPRSDIALQGYFSRAFRQESGAWRAESTGDLDFQHHLTLGQRHDLIWGLGYRSVGTDTGGSFAVSFSPAFRRDNLGSLFVQDDIALIPDRLRLTLGSKVEHNDYTGFEIEPSVRMSWTPSRRQTIWAASSRAVRTPARYETDLRVNAAVTPGPGGLPALVTLNGNPRFRSEVLFAYEAGYRLDTGKHAYIDLAAFFNDYDRLLGEETLAPYFAANPVPHLVVPIRYANVMNGRTYGLEAAVTWNPRSAWQVASAYSYLQETLRPNDGKPDSPFARAALGSPKHQANLRSTVHLSRNLEWNSAIYYVSPVSSQRAPACLRLDAGLTWRWGESLELGAGAQNLLDPRHPEFRTAGFLVSGQVPRNVWGRVTWRF